MGVLVASSRGGLLTRRGGALAAVIALHVIAAALLLTARIRLDEQPQPSLIRVAFLEESAPREAPPKLEPPPPVQVVMPRIEVPVFDFPESRAITAAPAPVPPPAAPPVVAQTETPVMLDVDEVDYLRPPALQYPRAAKQARLQGTVLLWVLIDPEGRPREVRVHRSSGHEQLDREGRDAVLRAQFKPYRHNGVPRSAQVIVPIEFTLTVRTARRN